MHGAGGQVEGHAPHVKGTHNWPALKQVRVVAHLHRQIQDAGIDGGEGTRATVLLQTHQGGIAVMCFACVRIA